MIRSVTNNAGVGIRFSDHSGGSFGQQGYLYYQHGDASTGFGSYNEQFQLEGNQPLLGFRVVGDIIASRRMGVNLTRVPNYTLEVNGDASSKLALLLILIMITQVHHYNSVDHLLTETLE